jgi:hypothetical protein
MPATQCNERPDPLDDAKRPSALQKAVDGSRDTGAGEGEDEPRAALLKSVEQQHGDDRHETEEKRISSSIGIGALRASS